MRQILRKVSWRSKSIRWRWFGEPAVNRIERLLGRPAPLVNQSEIDRMLAERGCPVERYVIDYDAFKDWQRRTYDVDFPDAYAEGGSRDKKTLEHYLSFEFAEIRPGEICMDVASHVSHAPDILKRHYQITKVYRQDLWYEPGIHGERVGGNAAAMPLGDCTVDVMTLHNSWEHFENGSDVAFLREAHRVLRPGGRIVIIPLFLADRFFILTSPQKLRAEQRVPRFDPKAQIVADDRPMIPTYSKHFDPAAFLSQVYGVASSLYQVRVLTLADPRCILSCPYALVLRKL